MRLYSCLLLLLLQYSLLVQKSEAVTIEQLAEKKHPADADAPAAILYSKGELNLELNGLRWKVTTTTKTRIKIYNKAGYDYATKELRYFKTDDYDCVVSNVATYNLEDGNIVKTEVNPDEIYTETVNEYTHIKKINMPNVREGSIIEYTYITTTPLSGVFPKWYFQYDIPVKYVEYELSVPTFFSYHRFMAGNINLNETKPVKRWDGGFEFNTVKYSAANVPKIANEPYSGNLKNYVSAIWFEIAKIDYNSGSYANDLSSSWNALATNLFEDEDFGEQIAYGSYFKSEAERIVKNDTALADKATSIFKAVQQRMAWNEREGYFTKKGIKWAYENKTGNVAEINLLLLALFQQVGINAHPVLLSTRNHEVATHPTLFSFNYVAVVAQIDGKQVLFDATDKNVKPGMLPVKALNYKGRLLTKKGASLEIELMPTEKSKQVVSLSAVLHKDGTISGKVRQSYYDYYGYIFREALPPQQDSLLIIEAHEKNNPGLAISGFSMTNLEDSALPVVENYDFEHNAVTDVSQDKLLFSPGLFFGIDDNPFTAKERELPIDYIYPFQHRYTFSIAIPQGYEAEHVPKSEKFLLPDGLGGYSYNISATNNTIQFVSLFDINYAVMNKAYYTDLQNFYNSVIAKQAEKIVLKKQ